MNTLRRCHRTQPSADPELAAELAHVDATLVGVPPLLPLECELHPLLQRVGLAPWHAISDRVVAATDVRNSDTVIHHRGNPKRALTLSRTARYRSTQPV